VRQQPAGLVVELAIGGLPRGVAGRLASSKAEWHSEGHDALGGTPYPPSSQLLMWKEEVGLGGHVDGLARHLGEVDEPRLLGPLGGDEGGLRSRILQLYD